MHTLNRVCLTVCTRCRPPEFTGPDEERPGYKLAAAILRRVQRHAALPLAIHMRGARCMSQCKRPCVVALSAPAKFTLLFGDLSAGTDAHAVITLAQQYAESSDGLVPRAERPAPLRAGILGRIAPLGFAGDIIDPALAFPPNPTKGRFP